jgi:hypothetical protein
MARKKIPSTREEEVRKHHEQRRGSMEGWSHEPVTARVDKGVGIVFSMRFSSEELRNLRDRARALKVTLSDLIRQSLFKQDDQTCMIAVSISNPPNYAVFGNTTCIASSCGSVGVMAGFVGTGTAFVVNNPTVEGTAACINNSPMVPAIINQGTSFSSGPNMVGSNDLKYALKFATGPVEPNGLQMYVWGAAEHFSREIDNDLQMKLRGV